MCLEVKTVKNIHSLLVGYIIREDRDNKYYPVWGNSNGCVAKLGDTITDPLWRESIIQNIKADQVIGAGCLHVFKNKKDALREVSLCYSNIVVIKVSIQEGLLLVGKSKGFSIRDPLLCYGCKSYKLIKLINRNS